MEPAKQPERMSGGQAWRSFWLWASVLIVILALGFATAVWYRNTSPPESAAQPALPDTGPQTRPDFVMSAEELWNAYTDSSSADAIYKGKRIQMTGKAGATARGQLRTIVNFPVQGPLGVMCVLDRGQWARASEIQRGQYLTVIGICTGKVGDVILESCRVE